ncbi:hypothetical protein HK097_009573 [Rhizophlyctis rosea]|uniref:Uncharacterized protein n=1 Tax=Rhizophlyctis rosea TaxID=64517 RepID=A0AAD5SAC5_9FUNG|nr:hypothetical protein HK097_009573 [Rhizophlyctis rosea]
MSRPLFNLAARQQFNRQFARHASTTSEATAQATAVASQASAQANAAASKAAAGAKNLASGVVGRVNGIAQPLIYYSQVAFHFARQVGTHAKVGVPDFGAATQGISNFTSAFKNGAWKKVTVRQVGQLAAEGVVISGFFLVGEMIGKGSIIGYQIPGTDHFLDGEGGH